MQQLYIYCLAKVEYKHKNNTGAAEVIIPVQVHTLSQGENLNRNLRPNRKKNIRVHALTFTEEFDDIHVFRYSSKAKGR